jgi:hypothetical protein
LQNRCAVQIGPWNSPVHGIAILSSAGVWDLQFLDSNLSLSLIGEDDGTPIGLSILKFALEDPNIQDGFPFCELLLKKFICGNLARLRIRSGNDWPALSAVVESLVVEVDFDFTFRPNRIELLEVCDELAGKIF